MNHPTATSLPTGPQPLKGVRVLSLALNLPGPAALMRLQALGAQCTKAEPPAGDPMALYCEAAYADMHDGVNRLTIDLKQSAGQAELAALLAQTDVLITSFRPSALIKLGLDWASVHARFSQLVMVTIVGAPGARADEPGHDLTYMAENDLVQNLNLPPTLYADMGGALATSEAVLQGLLARAQTGTGCQIEVALSAAAAWLARPRAWGLTLPSGDVGGAHAGYRVYACADGRVAVAALEPHFAKRLCTAAGLADDQALHMQRSDVHATLASFFSRHTRQALDEMAQNLDLPMHTLS